MRQLIVFITLAIIAIPQISYAEDEIIWQTEPIPYLHDIMVAPQGDIFYNIKGKDIQIRRIDDGMLLDSIIMEDIPNYLYHMSISADGRYMALIGDNPYVIIYDLEERREVKRITVVVTDHDVFDKDTTLYAVDWATVSISPDGKRIVGIARTDKNSLQTNLVVVDIETEEVIFEDRRESLYNPQTNPTGGYFNWIANKLTPDGNYIVAQLEFREVDDANAPDTIYIYDAHTLEVYDKVTTPSYSDYLTISSYRPMFPFFKDNHIYIYDIQNRNSIETNIELNPFGPLFSRNSNQIVYGFDFDNHIYDIDTREVVYVYNFITVPKEISLDNSKMLGARDGKIYAMRTYFTTTSIEDNNTETIVIPNPTTGLINVSISNNFPSNFNYDIINNSGQIIISNSIGILQPANNNNNINIDISLVPFGQYILRIYSDREEFTFNIIKED